jgi:hypothetical protein
MDTDLIVNDYFETLFPDPQIRADNLAKLGHFITTPETILIIQGNQSTGKKTLFYVLSLLGGELHRVPQPLFMNDQLFQWNSKLICITRSSFLVRPFPNLKPIFIYCQRHLNRACHTLPIIIHRNQIAISLQRLLIDHAQHFERYDLVPEYHALFNFVKNNWSHFMIPPHLHKSPIL